MKKKAFIVLLLCLGVLSTTVSSNLIWKNEYVWQQKPNGFSTRKLEFGNLSTGDLSWVDYQLEMNVKFNQFTQWGNLRVMVRQNGLFDCYCLNIVQDGFSLWRYDGDGNTGVQLGSYNEKVNIGDKNKLVITVKSNQIEVVWNGKVIFKAQDRKNRYPYGGVMFRTELALTEIENININLLKTIDIEQATHEMWEKAQEFAPVPENAKPLKTAEELGFNNMMLISNGHYDDSSGEWSFFDALPYVAYLDQSFDIVDSFFDAFLFSGGYSPTGRNFGSLIGGKKESATKKEDWVWYIDKLFDPQMQLAGFDKAKARVNEKLNREEKAKVVIMIPNPLTAQDDFGEINGEKISFSSEGRNPGDAQKHRLKAIDWYVKEIEELWSKASFENLELLGFYWMSEDIGSNQDKELVCLTADYLHEKNYKFFWIPYNKAPGYNSSYKFDAVFRQVNYMFNDQINISRFWYTYIDALTYGSNFEIEGEVTVFNDSLARERYLDYLKAGVTLGYINSAKAYYFGAKALATCALDGCQEIRDLYDKTYLFAKGKFEQGLWD